MKYLRNIICSALLVATTSVLIGCDVPSPTKNEIKIGGQAIGTFYNITVIGEYPGGATQLEIDAKNVLDKINDEMSTFRDDSMLAKFNASKSTAPMEVSQDIADAVITSLRVGHELNGATDITVGPLVNVWGFGAKKNKRLPTDAEIEKARKNIGLDKLHVYVSANKAYLKKDIPTLMVDLGTVGEGFGADKLAQLLDERGVQNYMVSIAGAIRTKGVNSRGKDWVVAIEHPSNDQTVGAKIENTVCTKGLAISTSGSYRNYVTDAKGKRESHIINPQTGHPIEHNTVSITVLGPSALWTDAIDTGLMVMGSQKALEYANEHNIPIYTIVKTKDGYESHYSRVMQYYLDCK